MGVLEQRALYGKTKGADGPAHCSKMVVRAPVAQWIEQSPPKGQVGRSIRLRGAKLIKDLAF